MPRFPQEESKIIELAQKVAGGIGNNAATFPNPPVTSAAINANLDAYFDKVNEIQLMKSELMQRTEEKNDLLASIVDGVRDDIDYVVIRAKGSESILQLVGWSNRAAPVALQPPGQCRALEILDQGAGWVKIDWKEPIGGGKPSAYKIQRGGDGTNFSDVGTSADSESILVNQPTMQTLNYRVIAFNKAGEGMPSNTISLVL